MGERFSRRNIAAHWRSLRSLARLSRIYAPWFLRAIARNGGVRRAALFPMRLGELQPAQGYLLWKIFAACGVVPSASSTVPDVAVAWRPETCYEPVPAPAHLNGVRVLNARCTDVRKSTVGRVFREVFGYSLDVNPLTFTGAMVRKSERNGAHDERIVQGPLTETEAGYVYQRLVSDPADDGFREYRVLVAGAKAAAAYRLYQPLEDRFRYFSVRAERVDVGVVFSECERARLAAFNERMGLDVGALDVLRDPADDRVYVIDCNPTATGPSDLLSPTDRATIVSELAAAFERAYFAPARTAQERTAHRRRGRPLRPTSSSDRE